MFESEAPRLLPAELCWRTVVPKQGETLRGWVVGPLCLHTVHFVNKASRPCRSLLTRGGMSCYCSQSPMSSRQVGYLPLMTKDREKVVVLMCATTAKICLEFRQGQVLEFWRGNKSKTRLLVKSILPDEFGVQATQNVARQSPWDIRPYLLQVLWQDAELCTYFNRIVPASGPEYTKPGGKVATYTPHRPKPPGTENTIPVAGIVQGLSDAFKAG